MDLRGETSADVWGGHPQTELDECAAGDEAEAEPEGVQAADPVSPVAPSESALHFHTAGNWLSTGCRWCESAFALLSHQKVTKGLTVLFFYSIIE